MTRVCLLIARRYIGPAGGLSPVGLNLYIGHTTDDDEGLRMSESGDLLPLLPQKRYRNQLSHRRLL